MIKIDICNQEVTIRTMSDRAVKIAINKALRSIDNDAGKVISWEVKGNRLHFTHTFSGTRSWKIVKAWAQIIETTEVVAEVATEQVVEVAAEQVTEVKTTPTATFIAEYIWTFTPTADGKTLWNSERVR